MSVTTTEHPAWAASQRQRDFITKLVSERGAPAVGLSAVLAREDFTKAQASQLISTLLTLPYARPAAAARGARAAVASLESVIPALPLHFAIPGSELVDSRELVFGVVARFKGHVYLRELHGSPGGFSRSRFNADTSYRIVAHLTADYKRYSDRFAAAYNVCGKCASPLTDATSRASGYGPTCRKLLGL